MTVRESARLIVIDPQERVLLFQVEEFAANNSFREPGTPARDRRFWITPGGGLEPGESYREAACREMLEETGFSAPELGEPLYYREKLLGNGKRCMLSQEHFFLVRLDTQADVSTVGHTEVEVRDLRGHRWWSLDELEQTGETVYPEGFAELVRRVLNRG